MQVKGRKKNICSFSNSRISCIAEVFWTKAPSALESFTGETCGIVVWFSELSNLLILTQCNYLACARLGTNV